MPNCLNILLIEDDGDDVELFTQALQDNGIAHAVDLLTDGMGIVEYLKNLKEQLPNLIVMDFNLPLLHGREVLIRIKGSRLKDIPLVVLTTSSAEEDKKYVYEKGASLFITKPASVKDLSKMATDIAALVQS
jgi:CheY-like chemotaxis protein